METLARRCRRLVAPAALSGLLSQFGLDAGKAALIAPILFKFLQSKLSPELMQTVTTALPMLAGGGAAPAAGAPAQDGGAMGMLSGLLK
ncbi:MAG: hypothetical protein JNM69_16305 [Archangium sp.]|nr:hypothetical protein [Archangium sp.]